MLEADAVAGNAVMERFAAMITREFTVPELLAQVRRLSGAAAARGDDDPRAHDVPPVAVAEEPAALPDAGRLRALPRLLVPGGRSVAAAALQARCRASPSVIKEWLSPNPTYGLSIYTAEYYKHIWVSIWRVTQAFFLATVLGVPFGLLPRLVAQVQGVRVPGVRDAAADPDPRLGAARDRDVHRHRVGGRVPRVPRRVLRHRAQHHARRRVDRRVVRPRRVTASGAEQVAGVPPRRSCRARCRSSSPGCRSRSACRGSRWSPPRWCPASTASAT